MNDLVETRDKILDELETAMAKMPQVDLEVKHIFTDGLYVREIYIPAGTIVTSAIHKTEHPFVISQGEIMVTSDNEGSVVYKAPYTGVTKPNTRRALRALSDVVWTTFHVTNETDIDKIGEEILAPKDNSHIEEAMKQKFLPEWRKTLPE